MMFTSGSTGVPKGRRVSHADVVALAEDGGWAAGVAQGADALAYVFDAPPSRSGRRCWAAAGSGRPCGTLEPHLLREVVTPAV
ncbi:hypothetical protein GXW82_07035 [Streptacidiphilus sp. 4-A2]|nr:hypothetical protein [Streptacidiphilus sp. 4-A2]